MHKFLSLTWIMLTGFNLNTNASGSHLAALSIRARTEAPTPAVWHQQGRHATGQAVILVQPNAKRLHQ